MGVLTDREQALAIARIGHAVLGKLHDAGGADVRARQRDGPGRRARGRAERRLPHGVGRGGRDRPARVLPGSGSGLGRRLPGAEPDRDRERRHAGPAEPAEPEPDARREVRVRAGPGRRDVRRRRLPGALAGLGRTGGQREDHRRTGPGRPGRRPLGRRAGRGPGLRGREGRRGRAGPVPGARAARRRPDDRSRRGVRRRGRGAGRPDHEPGAAGRACTRSTWSASAAASRPGRRTAHSPAR